MENSNASVLEYTGSEPIFFCSNRVTHFLSAFRRNLPRGHSFERNQERDPQWPLNNFDRRLGSHTRLHVLHHWLSVPQR